MSDGTAPHTPEQPGDGSGATPSGYPLAPPLGGPPQGAGPSAPPYAGAAYPPAAPPPASGAPTAYPAPPYPGAYPPPAGGPMAQPTEYPASPGYPTPAPGVPVGPYAPKPRRNGMTALIIALVAVGVVLVLGVAGLFAFRAVLGGAPEPIAIPSPSTPPVVPSEPSEPVVPSAPSTGEEVPHDDEPDVIDTDTPAGRLKQMIADYKTARDDGSLWEKIPDTEYNRTAVQAFLLFLTDMSSALLFGGDNGEEYLERAADLEQRLLDEQPLGDDIRIDYGDGRVFEYDGTTGEGGYVEG